MMITKINLYNKIKKYLGLWYKENCFDCYDKNKPRLTNWDIKYTSIKKDVDIKKYVLPYHWGADYIYKYHKTESKTNITEYIYEYDTKKNTLTYKKELVNGKEIEYYYLYNKNREHISTFKYINKVLNKVDVEKENEFNLSVNGYGFSVKEAIDRMFSK